MAGQERIHEIDRGQTHDSSAPQQRLWEDAYNQQNPSPNPHTYTVRPGDTMSSIGSAYGIPYLVIMDLNPDVEPRRMSIGLELNLPPGLNHITNANESIEQPVAESQNVNAPASDSASERYQKELVGAFTDLVEPRAGEGYSQIAARMLGFELKDGVAIVSAEATQRAADWAAIKLLSQDLAALSSNTINWQTGRTAKPMPANLADLALNSLAHLEQRHPGIATILDLVTSTTDEALSLSSINSDTTSGDNTGAEGGVQTPPADVTTVGEESVVAAANNSQGFSEFYNSAGANNWAYSSSEQFFLTEMQHAQWNPNGPLWSMNCGPASVASVIKGFGLNLSGSNDPQDCIVAARVAMTGRNANEGTGAGHVEAGLTAACLETAAITDITQIDQALDAGSMIVLYGDPKKDGSYYGRFGADVYGRISGDVTHWIPVVKRIDSATGEDSYVVNDPLSRTGPITISRSELVNFLLTTSLNGSQVYGVAAQKKSE